VIFRFDTFKLDTDNFTLSNNQQLIPVEPQVFDLIVYLITHRDKVTTRQQLFDALWDGRLVSDATLSNHIKTARVVLQDDGQKQSIIKTVRSRGYQFVAEVAEQSSELILEKDHVITAKSIAANSIKTPPQQSHSKKIIGLFVSIGLLAFFFFSDLTNPPPLNETNPVPDTRRHILVVPFEVSGDNAEKWKPFADQMTREVIRNLRKISGLKVIPSSSAFMFKKNKTPSFVRRQLPNVRYVLSAVVNIGSKGSVRITPILDDIFSGKLVWDDDYRSRIDDTNLFRVQSDIAASVSDSLKIVIGDEERLSLGEMPTKNLVAYELYIQGKYQFDLVTSESLYQSITLFSKAIELDSTFEAAYVAKADAYRMLMAYFEKPVDVLPNIIDAVVESLAINPDSAEARSSLGLAYVFAWRWNDAWNMLNDARNRNPNLALTELGFALYYSGLGDIESVHRSLDRAAILDPLNVEIADWGHWALAMVGETKEAIAWAKIQMEIHPQVGVIFSGASVSASMDSEHKRAIFLATRGLELDPENPFAQLVLAQAYTYAGEYNKALPLLNKAEKSPSYVCPYESAVVYLQLRNLDKTFDLLNDAVDFRSNCLVFVHNDSRLSSLRNDPRFISVLTRVGLDKISYRNYSR